MVRAAKDLPENINALKQLVSAKEQMLLEKDQRIAVLEEQLQLLMHKRFGASSEKASLDQLGLFNEAEATADEPGETPAADAAETTVCPQCGKTVIDREIYLVRSTNLKDGKCKSCGTPIAGVWT